jgi:hypothetical protein
LTVARPTQSHSRRATSGSRCSAASRTCASRSDRLPAASVHAPARGRPGADLVHRSCVRLSSTPEAESAVRAT